MTVIVVEAQIKEGMEAAFIEATLANARASVKEPGVARFDVLRSTTDPRHFTIIEAYRTPEAPAAHKASAHYAAWKEKAEPMMACPRTRTEHETVFLPPLA